MNKFVSALALTAGLSVASCTGTSSEVTKTELSVESILTQMTLEEKIGQVIQADISAVTPEDITRYNLGSVLNGGNSAPGGGVTASPEAWIALADSYWNSSTDTSDGGVGIPALWGTDAVHGHNNLQNATIFPHNIGLGAMNNPDIMEQIGDITAREVRATGIDWTFAPTLAVALDDRWGRTYESYSENPAIVAAYSKAMVEGLQGVNGSDSFLKADNVIATAKHFVGDGGTQFGIDKGDTIGSLKNLLEIHGAGYPPAINAGVQTVMASFSSINGEKMHGSKRLLTDILRDEMGFTGFVVGDWNGHAEVPGCSATNCPSALEAGIDMYMAPDSWKGLYESLLAQAKSGEVDLDRLDQAVSRILDVKIRSGLFDAGLPSSRASANPDMLGAPEHLAVARQAVRESLVLLKNENAALPLNPSQNILVTGSGADSMQQQTGGWTLSWQGDDNANGAFETGETIFSGLQEAAAEAGGTVVYSPDGTFNETPDVAIVVFGEQPYAEYRGDRSDLVFEFQDGENLAAIRSFADQGIPVVSVFLTGRPMWMNPHLNASDAFVVAWLPGTEGGGIADVLMADKDGSVRHDFKGKLSFSWPSEGSGVPIDDAADPNVLFPYGYGLTYQSNNILATLSEDPGLADIATSFDGTIFARGDAANPFKLYLGDSSNLNTPITAIMGSSLGGGVTIRGTDYKAQEDSRIISWAGKGKANVSIRSKRPINLSTAGDIDMMSLGLEWRLDTVPTKPMSITMGCGDGCLGELEINSLVSDLPVGEWTTSQIPLNCFVGAGLESDAVDTIISLASSGQVEIAIHTIEITKSDPQASCPS